MRAAALASWLRRARAGEPAAWVLRGSIVTAALCPGARAPVDVDYLVPGERFDPDALERAVRAAAAVPDPVALELLGCERIWEESPAPGLRAHAASGGERFQIDLSMGDPMCVPPREIEVADVGPVLACAPETLLGWKLHGLCEPGPGRWRAKDLYDVDLLWRAAALDRAAARAATELAFSSRALGLGALDDFRTRDSWGLSRGGRRKWRALAEAHPGTGDFLETRARVRAAVDALLG